MKLSNTHILIGVLIIIAVLALYFMNSKPIHNVGTVDRAGIVQKAGSVDDLIDTLTAEENKKHPITADTESIDPEVLKKFNWKNESSSKNASNSYSGSTRGATDISEWDQFYRSNSNEVNDSYARGNDGFQPIDETGGNSASYTSNGRKKQSPEDLFKVDELLPQEVNKNWFEVMPEPIKVKNRHLINVTRPVGVNTVGTSLKNPSYDIRGTPPCPKFVASPWLQSSIEPDINIKGLC